MPWTRLKKRSALVCGIVAAAILLVALVRSLIITNGCPWLARKWAAEFCKISSISEARQKRGISVREFEDGDWVFGRCRGSHGNIFGGVIVTRDSTGRVRAFLGHVCAPDELTIILLPRNTSTLEDVYSAILYGPCSEYEWRDAKDDAGRQ